MNLDKYLLITLLHFSTLFYTQNTYAQLCSKEDSLSNALAFVKDTARVNTFNNLARETLSHSVLCSNTYANRAKQLATQLNYKKGIADAYIIFGDIKLKEGVTLGTAFEFFEKSLIIYEEEKDKPNQAKVHRKIADTYYELYYMDNTSYEMALKHYLLYLKIAKELDNKQMMLEAYDMVGKVYSHLNEEEKSLANIEKAVELARQVDTQENGLLREAQKIYDLQKAKQAIFDRNLYIIIILLTAFILVLIFAVIQNIRTNKKLRRQKEEILEKKQVVEEQKEEITIQKENIEEQKKDIETQNAELIQQSEEIQSQKENIETQNVQILKQQTELTQRNAQLQDLTANLEQKVLERTFELKESNYKLSEANEELDLLIYRASHDFKGPVATFKGLCQLGKIESQDEKAWEFFDKIALTAHKMDIMLDKLHLISHIDSKKIEIEQINIREVIENVQYSLDEFIQESNAKIVVNIEKDLPLYADGEILEAIISNIVENAIFFAKKNTIPEITIIYHTHHTFAEVEIQDKGSGIAPQTIPKLGKMFLRDSEQSRGNGLGFYAIKTSLDRLEGNFKVESVENEYTTVKFTIPNQEVL